MRQVPAIARSRVAPAADSVADRSRGGDCRSLLRLSPSTAAVSLTSPRAAVITLLEVA
jgi:hypothetical protein